MNREWDIDSGEDGNNIEELNSIEMLSGSILAIIKNRHVN